MSIETLIKSSSEKLFLRVYNFFYKGDSMLSSGFCVKGFAVFGFENILLVIFFFCISSLNNLKYEFTCSNSVNGKA